MGLDLRREQFPRRLDVDQGIDLELGRYDIGPFVQDAVKLGVVFDVEERNRAAAHPRIDVLADTGGLVGADPWPKALAPRGNLGRTLGTRGRDDEKQGGHEDRSVKKGRGDQAGTIVLPIGQSAMPASFRCAQAKGMPMIVIAKSTAVMR